MLIHARIQILWGYEVPHKSYPKGNQMRLKASEYAFFCSFTLLIPLTMETLSKIVQSIEKPVFLVASWVAVIAPAWITTLFFTGNMAVDAFMLILVVSLIWAAFQILLPKDDWDWKYSVSAYDLKFYLSVVAVSVALLWGLWAINPIDKVVLSPVLIFIGVCIFLVQLVWGLYYLRPSLSGDSLRWWGRKVLIPILWLDAIVIGVLLHCSSPAVGVLSIAGITMILMHLPEKYKYHTYDRNDGYCLVISSFLATIIPLGTMIFNLRNMEMWGSVVLWHVLVGIVAVIVAIVLLLVGFAFLAGLWEKRQDKKKRQAIAEAEAEAKTRENEARAQAQAREKARIEEENKMEAEKREQARASWKEFLENDPKSFESLNQAARFSRFIDNRGEDFANLYLTIQLPFRLISGVEISDLKRQIVFSNDLCVVIRRIGWVAEKVYQDDHLRHLLSLIDDLEQDLAEVRDYKGYDALVSLIEESCPTLLAIRKKVQE
jgi:uncharacterized membrane protein